MSALADKDANAPARAPADAPTDGLPKDSLPKDVPEDAKTNPMEYHRKVLADKIAQQGIDQQAQYVSPSDNLMSPCTAKLSALRSKKVEKSIKPKSLFQKASARNLGSSLADSKTVGKPLGLSAARPVSSLAAPMTPPSLALEEEAAKLEMVASEKTGASAPAQPQSQPAAEPEAPTARDDEVDVEMKTD